MDVIELASESADLWVKEMRENYPQADPWQIAHASFLPGAAWKPGDIWSSLWVPGAGMSDA